MHRVIDPRSWTAKYPNKVHRDNYLKAVLFRSPDWIPCSVSFFDAVWARYREGLRDLVSRHPFIFGTYLKWKRKYDRVPSHHQGNTFYKDNWGCGWQVIRGGYEGQVVEHPLADWNAFASYRFPDPVKFSERGRRPSWRLVKWGAWFARKYGLLLSGGGERLFDRLYFLRGFDNLMRDFATNNPLLKTLIARLQDHEITLVKQWLKVGVDQMSFHTDIGTQNRLMISPRQFRHYIKPIYAAIFAPCCEAGVPVYLSSDGYLLDIVEDLVECGVAVHDPQYAANTVAGIAKRYKGKLCVDLDLDRQGFPFLSPEGIKRQIKDAVDQINTPDGGLMMKAEIGDPAIPLENIEAICQAMEEYCIPRK